MKPVHFCCHPERSELASGGGISFMHARQDEIPRGRVVQDLSRDKPLGMTVGLACLRYGGGLSTSGGTSTSGRTARALFHTRLALATRRRGDQASATAGVASSSGIEAGASPRVSTQITAPRTR